MKGRPKKEVLPTDILLKEAFIYPESPKEARTHGHKGTSSAVCSSILQAKLTVVYRRRTRAK